MPEVFLLKEMFLSYETFEPQNRFDPLKNNTPLAGASSIYRPAHQYWMYHSSFVRVKGISSMADSVKVVAQPDSISPPTQTNLAAIAVSCTQIYLPGQPRWTIFVLPAMKHWEMQNGVIHMDGTEIAWGKCSACRLAGSDLILTEAGHTG